MAEAQMEGKGDQSQTGGRTPLPSCWSRHCASVPSYAMHSLEPVFIYRFASSLVKLLGRADRHNTLVV